VAHPMDKFNEQIEELRNSVRAECKICMLASLVLETEKAEAAGDHAAALQGYQWLLEKLFPREFGDRPPCKCQRGQE